MFIALRMPRIINATCTYSINNIYVRENEMVKRGTKLLDIRADLHASLEHDCPSVNFYRLVSHETAWVQKITVNPGQQVDVSFLMGIFSTEEIEKWIPDAPIESDIRISYAGIIHEVDWFNLDK